MGARFRGTASADATDEPQRWLEEGALWELPFRTGRACRLPQRRENCGSGIENYVENSSLEGSSLSKF